MNVEVIKIGVKGKQIGSPRVIPESQLAQYRSRGFKMADGKDIVTPEEVEAKKKAKKTANPKPVEEPKE